MKKKLSFVYTLFFMFVAMGTFISCSGNKNGNDHPPTPPVNEKPKPEPTPVPNPTTPEEAEDEKVIYQWYYRGSTEGFSGAANFAECPADFVVEGNCQTPLSLCKRKASVYSCFPENLEVRVTGKVVDENDQPLENVKINGSLGLAGYNEFGVAYSKKNGSFVLKIQNACVPIIIVLKDGYTNSLGKPNASVLTRCKVDNFTGAKDLLVRLKKAHRTANAAAEAKSEEQFCRIVGRVMNPDGSGLAEVKVNNGRFQTLSDKDGFYVLEKNEKCENYCLLQKANYRAVSPYKGNTAIVSCFQGQPTDVIFERKNSP